MTEGILGLPQMSSGERQEVAPPFEKVTGVDRDGEIVVNCGEQIGVVAVSQVTASASVVVVGAA